MAPKKEEETLRYDRMVERALRGVVQAAVREVIKDGLSGDHHFYITFLTEHEGVKIPDYLRERYPGEMTIVLQYQFYDLEVDDRHMGVTLSFNNVPERLEIPLNAITIFADPSVNFALQFQPLESSGDTGGDKPKGKKGKGDKADKDAAEDVAPAKSGEVVSLDQFRKK